MKNIDLSVWPIQELQKFIDSNEKSLESFIDQKLKYIKYQLSKKQSEKYKQQLIRDQDHYLMIMLSFRAFRQIQRQYKNIVQYEIEVASHQLFKTLQNECKGSE